MIKLTGDKNYLLLDSVLYVVNVLKHVLKTLYVINKVVNSTLFISFF